MSSVTLIFPHQLFKSHPSIQAGRSVILIEEWLFFQQYNFHKQKLVMHRAAMRSYNTYLQQLGFEVSYIETTDERNDVTKLINYLALQSVSEIHLTDVTDDWLLKRIKSSCLINNLQLVVYKTPSFLNTAEEVDEFFTRKKKYFQTDFYIEQRKQRNILLEPGNKPIGDKWTFDYENRLKFPKNGIAPRVNFNADDSYTIEAKAYVLQHFADNVGEVDVPHFFAINFKEAEENLSDFLHNRFKKFGVYEDAIVADENVLHHSVLTPMLNTGLLTPKQVIDAALEHAGNYDIPLNSLEGFIRQVMGWREFIKIVYDREGGRQRTTNYWKFTRKIPDSFWKGSTGIAPVDTTIKKILKTGYCHHIERLMVLGNFMLLCEFDPDDVYRWFMELFIDAYDWVMVPNVYGMTQFADGGIMATKPYISGSNYLMKMSDYLKGDWQQIWDGLFWRFMHVHRDFFSKNPRLAMLLKTFDKMPAEKQALHLDNANNFLNKLDLQDDHY